MAFAYYSPFPVAHAQCGASDSTNFPVYLAINDARFKSVGNGGHVQSSNGYDMRAYSDTGPTTAYVYELVPGTYNATTGAAEMHIKVPTLSHTVDTVVQLFYGDSGITTDGSSSSTWNSNFTGVWHWGNGSSLSLSDSTSNANTLTNNNGVTATAGQVGGAMHCASASSQSSSYAGTSFAGTFSTSGWFNVVSATAGGSMCCDTAIATHVPRIQPATAMSVRINGGTNDNTTFALPTSGVWHYWHITRDAGNIVRMAMDGGTLTTLFSGVAQPGTISLKSFGNNFNGNLLNGSLDEVRISSAADSADWITAAYNNQSSAPTFAVMGTEVPIGGAAGFFTNPNLLNGLGAAGPFFANPLG